jgi:hypothetical protein
LSDCSHFGCWATAGGNLLWFEVTRHPTAVRSRHREAVSQAAEIARAVKDEQLQQIA